MVLLKITNLVNQYPLLKLKLTYVILHRFFPPRLVIILCLSMHREVKIASTARQKVLQKNALGFTL